MKKSQSNFHQRRVILSILLALLTALAFGQEGYNPGTRGGQPSPGGPPGGGQYSAPTAGKARMRQLRQVWSKDFLKGQRISGTFNRTDIHGVLRLFYEQTGLNFIVTENVRGTLTGQFNNVPALEALITVLRVNNLYFIEEGSIIRIVPPDEYREDIIKKNLVTRVYDINHAQMKILSEALAPLLTEGVGSAVLDPKTNRLLVTDLADNFPEIEQVLKDLSGAGKQVYIDIKVVSITLKKENEHGINWSVMNVGNYLSFSTAFESSATRYGQIKMNHATAPNGITGEGLVRMLNTFAETKLLTSPKIVAAHGEPAKIHIGDDIPYVSKTSRNQTTNISESEVQFLAAGIKVEVTPFIGDDGTIRLKFMVEISRPSWITISESADGKQIAPQKTMTKAESYILCNNNALVVIGGLFEDRDSEEIQSVPLLGSIPIIKYLFSWSSTVKEKREIAIMIRPTLIESTNSQIKPEIDRVINQN